MHRHHHGYSWLGSGFELHRDGVRRDVHPDFRSSPVPPLEVAQWLLKPASFVQGSWSDGEEAARWFGGQVRPHAGAFVSAFDRDVLDARIAAVGACVADGGDVVGGWWLTGQRMLSVSLVGCSPHRVRSTYPCPVGRASGNTETGTCWW
ncbi:hypothetical protein ABCR94_25035 [Streptomyces sp. 21So2-11]|uniref:hypothetical protein n=1 Tax=Streptomyces sp. 21So2-11 TaxID=3144408 RepID=UPI003219986F